MTYCTAADVARILQGRITLGTATKPTLDDVTSFIEETEGLVNSLLKGCGYTVPIVGTTDVLTLRGIVANMVAVKAYEVAFDDESPFLETLKEQNTKALELLNTCMLTLVDQSSSGSSTSIGTVMLRIFDDGDDD